MRYVIGVDFDNTIVTYDNLMHKIAVERGLISPKTTKSKRHIRENIRQLPDGEIEWQRLQAVVYGPRIEGAKLTDGVEKFFQSCKSHRVKMCIVSHKTKFAKQDLTRTNLREAALAWMERNRFFEVNGLGLHKKDVYFVSTRNEKIMRIEDLGCTHFIDDLIETFLEDSFPANTEKILYLPHGDKSTIRGIRYFKTWMDIDNYLFSLRS